TCLFNSHIPHGNASLLLRRVKVQDRGRYKCYTSTRKVMMEMTDEMVTCSSHNIFPVPQLTWTIEPPSAQEALENSTIKTTDHKGLFTVESTLRILGNLPNHTYICSVVSADKTQEWTASRKNQEGITQEVGHPLSIPCISPHSLQNFSLTWTFTSSSDSTVIFRYDSRSRQTFNLWEGQAELDQDLLLQGDGSLLLHKPDREEHSGTYTCTFSGPQSRHVIQTKVNITVPSNSEYQSVLFLCNGAGLHKDLNTTASYTIVQHGVECRRVQLQFEVQDEQGGSSPKTGEDLALPADTKTGQQETPIGIPVEGNDGLQSISLERD
uniref:HERV-H LTR-associating 2a, tandem duplicate 2 n=1 Tax=Mastacembelus armatus TaxID=205130 RepID=A0A7N9AKQ8_9TELE